MANIEYYTFGEVTKALGIPSSKVNDLIDAGKLKPVRHLGVIKFSKTDVENILKEEMLKQRYTWTQVLRELQIEDAELHRLIQEGEIKVYKDQDTMTFDKKDIEAYKHAKQVHDTIVVEKQSGIGITKIPEISAIPEIQIPDMISSIGDFLPTFPQMSKPSPKSFPKERYYSFDEVLTYLQIEASELEQMISDGEISLYEQEGKRKFSKAEIDFMRSKRMVDATMVVESVNQIVEEDDEIQPFVISAAMEAEPYVPPTEEYYTFEEALYELQLEPSELKRMISRNEIYATKDKDGLFLLKKEDVDSRAKKIEPTVILPDEYEEEEEINTDKEDTMVLADSLGQPLYQESLIQDSIEAVPVMQETPSMEKSFYSTTEASIMMKTSVQQLESWLLEEKIRTLHYLGKPSIRRVDLQRLMQIHQPKAESPVETWKIQEEKSVKKVPSILSLSADASGNSKPVPSITTSRQSAPTPLVNTKPALAPSVSAPKAQESVPANSYTLQETLQLLKIDQKKLQMMVASGEIKYKKIGKNYLFEKSEIDKLLPKEKQESDELELFEIDEIAPDIKTPEKKSQIALSGIEIKQEPRIAAIAPKAPSAMPRESLTPRPAVTASKATPVAPKEEETCTIQEAMKILSVGKSDIQRFIDGKYLTVLPGNLLKKKELQDLRKNSQVDITMVLPLSPDEEEVEEEDVPTLLNAPKVPPKKAVVPLTTTVKPMPQSYKLPEAQPKVVAAPKAGISPATKAESPTKAPLKLLNVGYKDAPATPGTINLQNYYTFQQVLTELQLEKSELESFLQQHGLKSIDYQGKKWFKREEIDVLKRGKMIEPTIMVGNEVDDILEDDDDDMFFKR